MATTQTVYSDARSLIDRGGIELLTSDVFDTLLWRDAASPHDLFVVLGGDLVDARLVPDHVSPEDVLDARIHAERRARTAARRDHGVGECTIEEIWQRMPAAWIERIGGVADGVTAEIEMEQRHLRPIEPAIELLQHAHDAGVSVALVSDTYFSREQLLALFAGLGIELPPLFDVVVSSEHRDNKAGKLLAHALEHHRIDPRRVLHIGDNPHADAAAAHDAGTHFVGLDIPHSERIGPAMPHALASFSAIHGTDAGASALSRELLLMEGGARAAGGGPTATYEFGVTVGGPLLTGFADWITARTTDLGVGKVHYLLREGGFISDVVAALRPDAPRAAHVHASRWVMGRAAVIEGTSDELVRALIRRAAFRPDHVTEAFDVDRATVTRVIGDGLLSDADFLPAIEAMANDEQLRTAIVASSAALRARVMRYLQRALDADDHNRIVVCDIGWGGTIQEALHAILAAEGWSVELIGLYLMLSRPGRDRVAGGARMAGFLPDDGVVPIGVERSTTSDPDIVMRTPEIVEQLCTPEIGTLVDIDDSGSPVLADDPGGALESRRTARRGVLDYARLRQTRLPEASADQRLRSDAYRRTLLAGLAGTIRRPSARLAQELGTWEHDDVGGRGHEPLVPAEAAELLRFANAADTDMIGTRHVYWLHGAAALANSELAAQLDAVEAGVAAAELCPPSEVGQALIAVFPPDDVLASAQVATVPHRSPRGWSMLRLTAAVGQVREVRIDIGTAALSFELGRLHIIGASGRVAMRIDRTNDERLRWVGGHPTDTRGGVLRAGGFLTVPFEDPVVDDMLEIDIAFRARPAGQAVPRITPRTLQRRARGLASAARARVEKFRQR
ncbi:MAG: HAD hydrolase-like protein [Actinomycetota bacterium]